MGSRGRGRPKKTLTKHLEKDSGTAAFKMEVAAQEIAGQTRVGCHLAAVGRHSKSSYSQKYCCWKTTEADSNHSCVVNSEDTQVRSTRLQCAEMNFCVTVCKTVHPMLSDRCLSVLSCLWRWCIVAKRFDGSTWNLACRWASALATLC